MMLWEMQIIIGQCFHGKEINQIRAIPKRIIFIQSKINDMLSFELQCNINHFSTLFRTYSYVRTNVHNRFIKSWETLRNRQSHQHYVFLILFLIKFHGSDGLSLHC